MELVRYWVYVLARDGSEKMVVFSWLYKYLQNIFLGECLGGKKCKKCEIQYFDDISKDIVKRHSAAMPLNGVQYDKLIDLMKEEWNSSCGSPVSIADIENMTEELGVLHPPRDFSEIPLLYTRKNEDMFKEFVYDRCVSLKRELFDRRMAEAEMNVGSKDRLRFEEKVLKRINEHLIHTYIEMHILSGYECTDEMMMHIHKYKM